MVLQIIWLHICYFVTKHVTFAAEGGPPFGGYALSESRKVRLCEQEVPQSCLDIKSPDACVNQVGECNELDLA